MRSREGGCQDEDVRQGVWTARHDGQFRERLIRKERDEGKGRGRITHPKVADQRHTVRLVNSLDRSQRARQMCHV